MNGGEIIKAFEYCINTKDCGDCSLVYSNECKNIGKLTLDLITRQQETIDELTEDNRVYKAANALISRQRDERDKEIECLESQLQSAKTGAVREFAEKLKSMLSFGRYTSYEQIDNLVKEMTEGEENIQVTD